MERYRAEAHFNAAKADALKKGKETKELESDQVVLEAAYQKALETETDQIQMDDFADVMDPKVIQAHKQEVYRLKKIFESGKDNPANAEQIKLGKILEAIVVEQIELNEWLGPNVNTQQTSEFDDYVHGIDFVTEFNEDGALRHMGFAIDATHGKQQTIQLKLEKIRSQLNRGELGEVSYFQTVDKSIQGRKRFIPKVVLALEKRHVLEIARLWVRGEQKALADHPVKQTIMREMLAQLEGQLGYAKALDARGNPKAAKLVEVLSSQFEAMQRLFPVEKRNAGSYVDQGADTIQQSTETVFAPENADRVEELDLALRIQKGLKKHQDVSELQQRYYKLIAQQGKAVRVTTPEKPAQVVPIQKEVKRAPEHPLVPIESLTREELVERYQTIVKKKERTPADKETILAMEKQLKRLHDERRAMHAAQMMTHEGKEKLAA